MQRVALSCRVGGGSGVTCCFGKGRGGRKLTRDPPRAGVQGLRKGLPGGDHRGSVRPGRLGALPEAQRRNAQHAGDAPTAPPQPRQLQPASPGFAERASGLPAPQILCYDVPLDLGQEPLAPNPETRNRLWATTSWSPTPAESSKLLG